MMVLNQLRELIDRTIARAAHLGSKTLKVRVGPDTFYNVDISFDVDVSDGIEVIITTKAPNSETLMVPHGLRESDSEEVSEAADDLLAEDRE